jgi:4-amino-4-deoxy-L-arabinose transferase-like glycosyltransferase
VLLVASLFWFGIGTGTLPLMDRDEPRFAEASREMLESGDWIIPRLNGRYRFDKPPLIYWLQAASLRWMGPSEAAVRWPSVLCATATLGVVAAWGRRLAGERAGLYAGLVWATCPQAFVHAHLAVADMVMVVCFTVACWAGWEAHRAGAGRGSARGWLWLFFASLALGFLAKGPVAWLAALPAMGLSAGRTRVREGPAEPPSPWRRPSVWAWGWMGTLAAVGLWGVPALLATGGEFLTVGIGKHVVARSVGVLEGHGWRGLWGYLASLPFYPLAFLAGFLPWSPWMLALWWRRRRDGPMADPIERYLATGIVAVFLVFTLVRTKLPHYTLPAFPLIALWMGRTLADLPEARGRFRRLALASAVTLGLVAGPGLGFFARLLPVPRLATSCRSWIHPSTEIATLGFEEPGVYWYFRPAGGPWVRHLQTEAEAVEFLGRTGSRVCLVADDGAFSRLSARFPDRRVAEATGFNPANGRTVNLRALSGDPR